MDAALCQEVGTAGSAVLQEPVAGKGAVLDLLEDFLHFLLGLLSDDTGSNHVVAILGSIGNRLAHLGHAALIEEVDDELHLMEALEVSHLRLVAGFHQGLETSLHESADTAAEDSLLAEEVSFSLILEGSLDSACTGTADTAGISQGQVEALAGSIFLSCENYRHAAAFGESTADQMTRALGSHHEDIHIFGGNDLLEVNIEAMSEGESAAGLEVRGNLVLVDICLLLIRNQDHGDVSLLHSLSHRQYLQAMLLSFSFGLGTLIEADNYIHAAFLQVQGMGMALAAVADNGNGLAVHDFPVDILIIVSFCHSTLSPHSVHI